MSGHTPGPWTVTPDSFVMAGSRPSIGVARIITHAQEFVANARLIAAAPDLLEACRAVLLARIVCPEDMSAEVELVRAAIAKAEGR